MIKDDFKKITDRYSKKVEEAILAGNFNVIERSDGIVRISVIGEDMTILIYDSDGCYVWMIRINEDNYYLNTKKYFTNSEKCKEMLSNISEEEKEQIQKEIEELQNKILTLQQLGDVK